MMNAVNAFLNGPARGLGAEAVEVPEQTS